MAKPSVTERDQFWLDHEAALAGSGLTTKEYAAEHGLSFHAFYQARKRLRALGLLPPADQKRKPTKKPGSREPVAFSKVEIRAPSAAVGEFRLSLPNGFVLEWSGPEVPEGLVGLLGRLVPTR
jgi:hypothetical protein